MSLSYSALRSLFPRRTLGALGSSVSSGSKSCPAQSPQICALTATSRGLAIHCSGSAQATGLRFLHSTSRTHDAVGQSSKARATDTTVNATGSSARDASSGPDSPRGTAFPAEGFSDQSPEERYRRQRKEKDAWRCAMVVSLPPSATSDDVRALARGSARVRTGINRVRMLYNRLFNPTGRAIVTLTNNTITEEFTSLARNTTLAGFTIDAHTITATEANEILCPLLGNSDSPVGWYNASHLRFPLASVLLTEYGASGRLVHFRGLPARVNVGRLERLLIKGSYEMERPGGLAIWSRYLDAARRARTTTGPRRHDGEPTGGRPSEAHYTQNEVDTWNSSSLGKQTTGFVSTVIEVPPSHAESATRSFLLRFACEDAAHRFVRRWHRMPFDPERFGPTYIVDANIMY